jgi:hypothetical protein
VVSRVSVSASARGRATLAVYDSSSFAIHHHAAQQAHAVDAAARPRDRGDFEKYNQPECSTDLKAAAQLMGRALGERIILLSVRYAVLT